MLHTQVLAIQSFLNNQPSTNVVQFLWHFLWILLSPACLPVTRELLDRMPVFWQPADFVFLMSFKVNFLSRFMMISDKCSPCLHASLRPQKKLEHLTEMCALIQKLVMKSFEVYRLALCDGYITNEDAQPVNCSKWHWFPLLCALVCYLCYWVNKQAHCRQVPECWNRNQRNIWLECQQIPGWSPSVPHFLQFPSA